MAYIKSRKHGAARHATKATAFSLAFASFAVSAAEPAASASDEATSLPPVVVQGQKSSPYKVDKVASPKYTAPLVDTPQTITVVTSKLLQEQNKQSLVEALSNVPGITFGAGEGGGGYGDSINFRGYSANNSITIDGLRDSGQYNRSDTFNFEQIEVFNGANSVYAGAGNVSGSINLVSKVPTAEDFGRISLGAGTDKYGRVTADLNRVLDDSIAARLNLMGHVNDVPGRDVERFHRWGVAPSVTFGLNRPTKFTLSYFHQQDNNIPQYGVPVVYNPRIQGVLPGVNNSNYYGYRNIDVQDIQSDSLTSFFDHRFTDKVSLRNTTRLAKVTQFARVDPPQGGVSTTGPSGAFCLANGTNAATGAACSAPFNVPGTYYPNGPRGNTRDTNNELVVNQTDVTWNFLTGAFEHTLVTGLSLAHERYHLTSGNSERFANGATPPSAPMNLANPYNVYTGPINFIPASKTDSNVGNAALYAFDNLKLNEQWQVNGGVRFEHNRGEAQTVTIALPSAGGAQTAGPEFKNQENLLSYRLGVVFKPTLNSSVYLAYANSKTPSQATVNGGCSAATCNVEPEKARNLELGTKWDLLNNGLSLTASVFRNELQNFKVASNDPTVPDQQTDGKSRVTGLALGATGQLTSLWSVMANYTYLDSKILEAASRYCNLNPGVQNCLNSLLQKGNPLTNTPKHAASLWTTYKVAPNWTLGYGASYQGSFYVISATPTYKSQDYWVQNALVAFKASRNLELQLNVKNLADKSYLYRIRSGNSGQSGNTAATGWALPGEGRSAVLTANYTF